MENDYGRPGACLRCELLRVERVNDDSGCEAKCTARSQQGRIICWKYGLYGDGVENEATVRKRISRHIAPAWCPERKKGK